MKKVLLIFAAEDLQRIKKLLPLLADPEYEIDFYEGPIPLDFESDSAGQLKRQIGEKIVEARVSACLISEETHKDVWVDCALQKSRNKGNKIIAMALKGVECVVLPAVIREENLTFYPWNPRRLAELITEKK